MMSLEDFGRALVETEDLDPVYVALAHAELPPDQLRRWLMAYWCCYDMGASSYLSEQTNGWESFAVMAANEVLTPLGGRWPRGRERRHFRGQKAVDAVAWFAQHFTSPETPVRCLEQLPRPTSYAMVRNAVTVWPLFGPWIAFKVGDMLERVLGVPIDFRNSDVFFFDAPREAAELWAGSTSPAASSLASAHLASHLGQLTAPPRHERALNLQEYETILCKWKSHTHGRYPVGADTHEVLEALDHWSAVSETARCLYGVLETC